MDFETNNFSEQNINKNVDINYSVHDAQQLIKSWINITTTIYLI